MDATTRRIRVSHNVKTSIRQRADAQGLTISEWVRKTLERQLASILEKR